MGVTFRSGGYVKEVFLGKRTVKDGEACAIWNDRGQHRQVIGPERVWLFNSTVRFLTRVKAENHQYLLVYHRDGRVEHANGPVSMYINPAWHDDITLQDGIDVKSSKDCIIVYKYTSDVSEDLINSESQKIEVCKQNSVDSNEPGEHDMRVVRGPKLFRPQEGESVHVFEWSGTNGGSQLLEGQNKFSVLHIDQDRSWEVTLPVTTSDLAPFSAQLSFKYRLVSLEKLLQVKDPFKKMMMGLRSDGQSIGNIITSENLRTENKETVISTLSSLKTYSQLVTYASDAGFDLFSVSLISLIPGDSFQRQAETEQNLAAKIWAEKAEQAQRRELYELGLQERRKKIEQEAELERENAQVRESSSEQRKSAALQAAKSDAIRKREIYELELEERKRKIEQEVEVQRKEAEVKAKLEEDLHALKEAAVTRELTLRRKKKETEKLLESEDDKAALRFLNALKEMDVSMTEFMCTAGGMKIGSAILSRSGTLNRVEKARQLGFDDKLGFPVAWEATKS